MDNNGQTGAMRKTATEYSSTEARVRELEKQDENIKKLRELVSVEFGKIEEKVWREEMLTVVDAISKKLENTNTRGANVARHNIDLQSQILDLNERIKSLEIKHDTKEDYEDGRPQDEQANNTTVNVCQQTLTSLSNISRMSHQRFRNPFNCPSSCVLSALFYITTMITTKLLCSVKFTKEMQKCLSKSQKELDEVQQGNADHVVQSVSKDNDPELMRCSRALEDLRIIDFICDEEICNSNSINGIDSLDSSLREAVQTMRQKEVKYGLMIVEYVKESKIGNHCMSIKTHINEFNPAVCAEVYDAQRCDLWQKVDKNIGSVAGFRILKIQKVTAEKFAAKCGRNLCRDERDEATSLPHSTGFTDDDFFTEIESWDLDF